MAEGDYVIPAPTTEQVDQLAGYLAVIDPSRQGVTMSQLRVFYPKLGWGHIQARLEALAAAGRVSRSVRSAGGPVPFEYWTLEG